MTRIITIEPGTKFYSQSGKQYEVLSISVKRQTEGKSHIEVYCPSLAIVWMTLEEIDHIMNSY